MKRTGPDSLQSWIIAVACCFINMMMYGMARLSGVLFVASVPRFHVGREEASFPYTFCNFMRNTSGPLVGYLGHKFGVRAVTTFGCLLGTLGIAMCYFAENIPTVTILWGTVFGLGFGLGNILLPVSINQYFDKHRATASGISFSGACLGSFALPPIVEFLLNTYGLSGTFLFLAGFVLNCVPAALLLKKPDFEINSDKDQVSATSDETQSIISGKKVKLYTVEDSCQSASVFNAKRKSEPAVSIKGTKQALESANSNLSNRIENPSLTYEERMKRLSTQTLLSDYSIRMSSSEPLDFEHIIQNSKGRRQVDPAILEGETLSVASQTTDSSDKDDVFVKENPSSDFAVNMNGNARSPPVGLGFYQNCRTLSAESVLELFKDKDESRHTKSFNGAYCNFSYQNDLGGNFRSCLPSEKRDQKCEKYFTPPSSELADSGKKSSLDAFSIICDPMFILITITNAIYCFTFVCMITVIVDYARDINIGETNEKYVLMSLSVGDLIGRLSLGSITDNGYMTKTHFAALCFCLQGIATTAVAWSSGFSLLMAVVAFYGLSEAGLILIFPLIVAQYIEKGKQTVAIPSSAFLSGPLCLAVAPLIGYFRDEIGSYDYIFYGITLVSVLCGISWLFAPCVDRCRQRRRT